MKAGRELDCAIAEKVMGIHIWTEKEIQHASNWLVKGQSVIDVRVSGTHTTVVPCPHYSTNIADAWMVVEQLKKRGYTVDVSNFAAVEVEMWDDREPPVLQIAKADTAPLAICLAALKAVQS